MKILLSFFLLVSSFNAFATNPSPTTKTELMHPEVLIETSQGEIMLELFPNEAPQTVANFLAYIQKDGYKNTKFHRVINNFMIQGGGFSAKTGKQLSSLDPIQNESRHGLSNKRGTISMARTNDPHSATRQFFINHADNKYLDAKNGKWGYTVFGKVTLGMKVVDRIASVKVGVADEPVKPVIINSITLHNKKVQ